MADCRSGGVWEKGRGKGQHPRGGDFSLHSLSNRLCTGIISLDPWAAPEVALGIAPTLQMRKRRSALDCRLQSVIAGI